MTKAFIGLGSNLGEPVAQILRAFEELNEVKATRLIKHSSLYLNPPLGKQDQPDFVNAVAKVETQLDPEGLLKALFEIEHKHHRIREEKNGPRTLDLDLLLYGDVVLTETKLTVPHYAIKTRAFVLIPLVEIANDLILPCGTKLAALVKSINKKSLKKLSVL